MLATRTAALRPPWTLLCPPLWPPLPPLLRPPLLFAVLSHPPLMLLLRWSTARMTRVHSELQFVRPPSPAKRLAVAL